MRKLPSYRIIAIFLTGLILCAALICVRQIRTVLRDAGTGSGEETSRLTADIYHDGTLLMSVPLDPDDEAQTFTIAFGETDYNEIQAVEGRIGVISASCPDQLCVHQGFQDSSLLPIVCLPNRLTIQIRGTEP